VLVELASYGAFGEAWPGGGIGVKLTEEGLGRLDA